MFLKGEVVVHDDIEYIIIDINYDTRMVTIGIPDPDNITRTKLTMNWRKIKYQS